MKLSRAIADAVEVPLIADADTGYGNAVNVVRTVKEYERAGAAAIDLAYVAAGEAGPGDGHAAGWQQGGKKETKRHIGLVGKKEFSNAWIFPRDKVTRSDTGKNITAVKKANLKKTQQAIRRINQHPDDTRQ